MASDLIDVKAIPPEVPASVSEEKPRATLGVKSKVVRRGFGDLSPMQNVMQERTRRKLRKVPPQRLLVLPPGSGVVRVIVNEQLESVDFPFKGNEALDFSSLARYIEESEGSLVECRKTVVERRKHAEADALGCGWMNEAVVEIEQETAGRANRHQDYLSAFAEQARAFAGGKS